MHAFDYPTWDDYVCAVAKEYNLTRDRRTTATQTEKVIHYCIVCMDRKRTHVATECGHFNYCEKCADLLVKCPLCNKNTKFTKLYS